MRYHLCILLMLNALSTTTSFCGTNLCKLTSRIRLLATIAPEEVTTTKTRSEPKVPSSAWRFPPKWPFTSEYTDPVTNMTLAPQSMSGSASSALAAHLQSFVTGMDSVLEIGCAPSSVLLESQVVAGSLEYYRLSDSDLRSRDPELPHASDSFDHAVLTSGIELVTEPRELLREVWRVLRPGGTCFLAFLDKPATVEPSDFASDDSLSAPATEGAPRPLKMWTTMNAEQKIWIAGSYFNYSSRFGWDRIEGYDLLSTTGPGMTFDTTANERAVEPHVFSVQASKASYGPPPLQSTATPLEVHAYLVSSLQGLRGVGSNAAADSGYNEDTPVLLAHRLTALHASAEPYEKAVVLTEYPQRLVQIYSVLRDVKEVVMPGAVKAMLAGFLVPKWRDTAAMKTALAQGVGLVPPPNMDEGDAAFWITLANATSAMQPRDKIALLGDLIPEMGSPGLRTRVMSLPTLVLQVTQTLRAGPGAKDASPRDLACIAADLCISDYLRAPASLSDEAAARRVIAYAQVVANDKAQVDQLAVESRVDSALGL